MTVVDSYIYFWKYPEGVLKGVKVESWQEIYLEWKINNMLLFGWMNSMPYRNAFLEIVHPALDTKTLDVNS